MFILLNTIWFARTIKYILFWVYLWQLKEYHAGRFIDHFRTHKGRQLLLNYFQILKLVLLAGFLFFANEFIYFFSALFVVYALELLVFAKDIILKSIKKPKITLKTIFLVLSLLAVSAGYIFITSGKLQEKIQIIWLLGFDILLPFIISVLVLIVQPIFVFQRNQVIKKAGRKLDEIKKQTGLQVIAITGSYGKTSTKEFLSAILEKKYNVLKTKEHQNSEIGIANAILNDLKPEHKYFIAETGAYNKGKIKEVCNFLKPKIGIVTGVNEQHLPLFGSLENLLSAEGGGELDQALPDDGFLVLNGDNKFCIDLGKRSKTKHAKFFYSMRRDKVNSEIWTEDVVVKKTLVSFVAVDKEKNLAGFTVNVLGKHNIENLLAAIFTASKLGMAFEEILEACKGIKPEQSGMVLKNGPHGINIIDSSYSANPDGVIADLDYLGIYEGKKIIVMPCLIELGKKSSEIHERIGRKIGKTCDLAIITTKDKFKEIKKGAMWSGMKEKDILLCLPAGRQATSPEEIYSLITSHCKSGDAVLLEGRVPAMLTRLLLGPKE